MRSAAAHGVIRCLVLHEQAAFELDLAKPKRVVARGRTRAALEHLADPLGPVRDTRRLLRWGWLRRQCGLDHLAQALELGQRLHVAVEQTRTRDRPTILALGVAADGCHTHVPARVLDVRVDQQTRRGGPGPRERRRDGTEAADWAAPGHVDGLADLLAPSLLAG